LRIIATLDEIGHAHIFGNIYCAQFSNSKPIHLIVDTGCSKTTILSDDVTRLGINCSGLVQTSPTATANGLVAPYELPEVVLTLEIYSGLFNRKSELRGIRFLTMNCNPPTQQQLMTRQRMIHSFSLLGMDFLRLFPKWRFTEKELYLDTV
jgi:predicted aspartyl protease